MPTKSNRSVLARRKSVSVFTVMALVMSLVTPSLSLASAPAATSPVSAAGRVSAAAVATITTEVAVTPAGAFSNWVNTNVDITLTATDVPPAQSSDLRVSYRTYPVGAPGPMNAPAASPLAVPQISAEGTTVVDYFASNVASGTQEATKTQSVRIDKTLPQISGTVAPTSSGVATVSVSTTDTLSGVESVRYSVDGAASVTTTTAKPTISVTGVGTAHTVALSALDRAGNRSATETVGPFAITDGVAPTTSISGVPAGWSSTTVTFTLTAVDNPGGTGVNSTIYRLNQTGSFVTYTGSVAVSAEGTTVVEFASVDKATPTGNQETTKQAIIRIDKHAPTSAIAGTSIAWTSANVTFTLSASDTPNYSGVAGIRYRTGASALATYTAPVVISAEGTTSIEYFAVDNAGNKETTQSATVRIDKTAPLTSVVAQADYDQMGVVVVAGSDALSGGVIVSTSLDGAAYAVSPSSATVTVSSVGTHTVNYYATDAAGNRSQTGVVTFHVTGRSGFVLVSKSAYLNNTRNPTPVAITMWLRDGATPIGGRRVILEYSSTSSFAVLGSVYATTTASGWVRFNRNISSRTYFRIRFAGDANYQAALSATVGYVPKVALSAPLAKSPQRARRAFTATGKIVPAHAKGRRVKIERYQMVGKKRVYRGYTWTTITSKGSYSVYSARLTLTRGTWLLRAVAPYDVAHAWTASGFRTISVR